MAVYRLPLLDFDLGSGVFELLLDRGRLVLVDALFDSLGGAIHQVLGFLQAQAGDFADSLDHVDFVRADFGEDDGELRLLLGRAACRARARRSARHHHWRRSSRRDSEGLFHFLDQVGSLEQRQTLDFFQNCFHFASDRRFYPPHDEEPIKTKNSTEPLQARALVPVLRRPLQICWLSPLRSPPPPYCAAEPPSPWRCAA